MQRDIPVYINYSLTKGRNDWKKNHNPNRTNGNDKNPKKRTFVGHMGAAQTPLWGGWGGWGGWWDRGWGRQGCRGRGRHDRQLLGQRCWGGQWGEPWRRASGPAVLPQLLPSAQEPRLRLKKTTLTYKSIKMLKEVVADIKIQLINVCSVAQVHELIELHFSDVLIHKAHRQLHIRSSSSSWHWYI